MEIAKACYSVSKLRAAYASDNLNRWLFDPEIELKEYRQAAYNYKAYKAEELNKMLRRQHRYICNELNAILTAINSGEVDHCE